MVDRQLQHRLFTTELRLPVRQLTLQLTRFQALALPDGIVGILDRQVRQRRRLAEAMPLVAADPLVQQYRHRPAIGDDMVHDQNQHVIGLVHLQ
ncbi:hypothetical protein D3C76_783180 [compost metagenome]